LIIGGVQKHIRFAFLYAAAFEDPVEIRIEANVVERHEEQVRIEFV
jgi:hypothetical protein